MKEERLEHLIAMVLSRWMGGENLREVRQRGGNGEQFGWRGGVILRLKDGQDGMDQTSKCSRGLCPGGKCCPS